MGLKLTTEGNGQGATEGEGTGELIGLKGLAAMLGIAAKTAERYKAMGKLPRPIELTTATHRWRTSEIREWIAAGCPDQATWEKLKRRS